jgi:hypothetical protein
VELIPLMTIYTFADAAETRSRKSSAPLRLEDLCDQPGLIVRDKFCCHPATEFFLDESTVAALSTLPVRGIIIAS